MSTTTSSNSTQTTARALVVKTGIQADITTAKVASTSEAARQKKKTRKSRRSPSSSNDWGDWHGGHERKGTNIVAESTVTIEEVKENDTEGTVDVPFNAWRLLQDQKHAAKDGAEAMDTAEHMSVQSAHADDEGDADDDDEANATVEDLVSVYKQSPDAEITAELYESLSHSWHARSDVDPVLGTIGYAKRKGGKAAEKHWRRRGKSTRGGSAM